MAKIPASERDAFYASRRSALAEVALRLWAERGFDQTPVAAIAREAGISKGTFYLYYESKRALLLDVLRRNSLLPNILDLIEDLGNKPLEEAVRGFVRGAWRHLADHRDLVLVLLRELPTHQEEAHAFVERLMTPGNQVLAEHLERHLPPERAEQISSVIAVRALIGMVVIVFITQEILGAGRYLSVSEDDITRTLAELFLRGVGADAAPGAAVRGVAKAAGGPA